MIVPVRLFALFMVLNALYFGSVDSLNHSTRTETDDYQVTLNFIHKVGIDPLEMDTIMYTNLFGNKYSVATLKYFVSNIMLLSPNGDSVQLVEAMYIDAAKINESGIISSAKVPAGTYSGVSFIFGLDQATNISGNFLNPPENRMEWPEPMGGGYHYMKLEGKIDSEGEINNFQAHTGRLNETPYFIELSFQVPVFTVDNHGITIPIIMDINRWWRDPNTIDLNNVTAIMGDHYYQQQLMENGKDVFTIGDIK